MVIEKNKAKTEEIVDEVTTVAIADANDPVLLKKLGVQNFDCAINCIGEAFEASVMITLLLKEAGVPKVVARATSAGHKDVLTRIGADQVVFPDEDMGIRLASRLSSKLLHESMDLGSAYRIVEFDVPKVWVDKSLIKLDIRRRSNVIVLMITRKNGEVLVPPTGEDCFTEGDTVLVFGQKSDVDLLVKRFV